MAIRQLIAFHSASPCAVLCSSLFIDLDPVCHLYFGEDFRKQLIQAGRLKAQLILQRVWHSASGFELRSGQSSN